MTNRLWLLVLVTLLAVAGCTDTDENTLDVPGPPVDNTLPVLEVSNVPPHYAQVLTGAYLYPVVRCFSSSATTGVDGGPVKLVSLVIQVSYDNDAPVVIYRNDTIDRTPTPTVYTLPPDTFRIRDRPGIETWRYLLTDAIGKQQVVQRQYEVIQDSLSPRINFLDGTVNNNTNVAAGGELRFNLEAIKAINGSQLSTFDLDVSYGNSPYVPMVRKESINPVRFDFDSTFTVERQLGISRWRFRITDAAGRTDTKIRTHYIL